jgi:hypothetical protein
MTKRPAMASDQLIAALDAAREKGCTRAVLLTETAEGIALHSTGEWSGLELRGLAVLLCEIVNEAEGEASE